MAYVRHQAKASAYRRIGHDSRSTWHGKRAMAHRQHFGDNPEANLAPYHVYGHSDWPEPKPKEESTTRAVINGLKFTGAVAAATVALGLTTSPVTGVLGVLGACSLCRDAYGKYKEGCKCQEFGAKRPRASGGSVKA